MRLSREASGYHLYLPCPDCLETHKEREVADPKYALNLSKLLGVGEQYAGDDAWDITGGHILAQDKRDRSSGICMRTRQSKQPHMFTVGELLNMGTVASRHADIHTSAGVTGGAGSDDRKAHWEPHPATGVLCPPPPGVVVPLTELPPHHPAIEYVTGRGFDPARLVEQFGAGFCTEEYPHGSNGIFYRAMPGGWRDTPQGRLIFHAMVDGVPLTWQGRCIEFARDVPGGQDRLMLHPYPLAGGREERGAVDPAWPFWLSHVASRPNASTSWIPVPPFDELSANGTPRFSPSKYRTAKYSNRVVMGWDAAVRKAYEDRNDIAWCVQGACEVRNPCQAASLWAWFRDSCRLMSSPSSSITSRTWRTASSPNRPPV